VSLLYATCPVAGYLYCGPESQTRPARNPTSQRYANCLAVSERPIDRHATALRPSRYGSHPPKKHSGLELGDKSSTKPSLITSFPKPSSSTKINDYAKQTTQISTVRCHSTNICLLDAYNYNTKQVVKPHIPPSEKKLKSESLTQTRYSTLRIDLTGHETLALLCLRTFILPGQYT
jgi:hypothetical protein